MSPDGAAAKAAGEIEFEKWAAIDATFSFRDAFLAGFRAGSESGATPIQVASMMDAAYRQGFKARGEADAEIADTSYQQAKMDEKNGYAIERGDTSACWIMGRIRALDSPPSQPGQPPESTGGTE